MLIRLLTIREMYPDVPVTITLGYHLGLYSPTRLMRQRRRIAYPSPDILPNSYVDGIRGHSAQALRRSPTGRAPAPEQVRSNIKEKSRS